MRLASCAIGDVFTFKDGFPCECLWRKTGASSDFADTAALVHRSPHCDWDKHHAHYSPTSGLTGIRARDNDNVWLSHRDVIIAPFMDAMERIET